MAITIPISEEGYIAFSSVVEQYCAQCPKNIDCKKCHIQKLEEALVLR